MKFFPLVIIYLTVSIYQLPALASGLEGVGNGQVYYLGVVKVYDAALYADQQARPLGILSPRVSKCLELVYNVSLEPGDFIKTGGDVLSRQLSGKQMERLRPDIDRLHSAYKPVRKGDRYRLCYNADLETTELSLNGETLVSIVSQEFSSAYFGIWLNPDQPLDVSLQKDLLSFLSAPAQENS